MRAQVNTFEAEREWREWYEFPVRALLDNVHVSGNSALPSDPSSTNKEAIAAHTFQESQALTYGKWLSISARFAVRRDDLPVGSHESAVFEFNKATYQSDESLVGSASHQSTAEISDDGYVAFVATVLGKRTSNLRDEVSTL